MPVTINELIIKGTVESNTAASGASQGGAEPASGGISNADRDALVRAIVEEVMRILDRQKER